MIKQISNETFLYYAEEFHKIVNRVSTDLRNAIVIPSARINNPEEGRDDAKLYRSFLNGLNIGFIAHFEISIPNIDFYTDNADAVFQLEEVIREIVTADDDILYVVTYDNLKADYCYVSGQLTVKFDLRSANRYAKM